MICENAHKYSISAMCKFLKIPRSTFYYKPISKTFDTKLENAVIEEFKKSRNNYGTRKLKKALLRRTEAEGIFHVSRRKIGKIMKKYGLVSNYTLKLIEKHSKSAVNNDNIENKIERKFNGWDEFEVIVSDLTYVKVAGKWHYICALIDLSNRMIIGSAVGKSKDAELVKAAFMSVKIDLRKIKIFHTDRGSEFKNAVIEEILKTFNIERSLSAKGSPIDNAVAESMYSIVKTEFAFNREFLSIEELEVLWFDYVNWFNNVRLHGSLGYVPPCEYVPDSFPDRVSHA